MSMASTLVAILDVLGLSSLKDFCLSCALADLVFLYYAIVVFYVLYRILRAWQ